MRIGIDIKCLRYNNSGIGRYLSALLDCLQEIDRENEYYLFAPRPIDYPINNPRFKTVFNPGNFIQAKLPGILWQQLVLPRLLQENRIDVFWGPEQTLPLKDAPYKKVLTIHDFVYRRYPETMRKSVRWINTHIGEWSIAKAQKLAVNSDFTKEELLHFFPDLSHEKIAVVPCGISRKETREKKERKRQLLFVGSLEPRKNLKNLVKALEILAQEGIRIPLIMTGPTGWKNSQEILLLKDSPVAKDIQHLGFVDDKKLDELYATSTAVIFPSFYEGFGLPILEALQWGTPVLTSKGSVMESIARDCGIYFDPEDPQSIADTLRVFLSTETPWKYLEGKEQERQDTLNLYRWEKSAQQLIRIFRELGLNKEAP